MMLNTRAVGPDGITFRPERLNANRAPNSRIVEVKIDTKAKDCVSRVKQHTFLGSQAMPCKQLTANFVLPNIRSMGSATLYSRISVNKSSLEFEKAR